MVTSWLVSSMKPSIGRTYLFLPTAKDVWDAVKETYSDEENSSQIFEIKTRLWQMKQGDRDVTDYYMEMIALWQELDLSSEEEWECAADSVRFKKRLENERVFEFLAGLNRDLDDVRGRILGRRPLSSTREVFAEVRREEARRRVMLKEAESGGSEISALVCRGTPNWSNSRPPKGRVWCDHCRKLGHTKDTCWEIHGKPADWKPKQGAKARGYRANSDHPKQGEKSTSGNTSNSEQLERIMEILSSLQNSDQLPNKASSSLAKKGNFLKAFTVSSSQSPWIIDTGASDHMTDAYHLFTSYKPCSGNLKVKIADGSLSTVAGKGSVKISDSLTLESVLHVPNLFCNLLSVSQLTKQANCSAEFFSSHCIFQDRTSGRTIGSAKEHEGLYYFDADESKQHQISTCGSVSLPKTSELMLWHSRMGHPSFQYLKHLFPSLCSNKTIHELQCEVCELAKHQRTSSKHSSYKPTQPFSLIHSDLWGPSRSPNRTQTKWFITFIDDHTRLCWVYLLKDKTKVHTVFVNFHTMIQTQFRTNIQALHTDNGTEYFNQSLNLYLKEHGIVHQSSCVSSPQQNGVAERKNRHILEVTRTLMFTTNLPTWYWGDAILTATYLINRMPSRVLSFTTPLELFQKSFPSSRLYMNLPLKVFGCTAFVHIHTNQRTKLSRRAVRCVFLGYSPTQKGYKCYEPNSRRLFVSLDVTFFETTPFYQQSSLQGENLTKVQVSNNYNELSVPTAHIEPIESISCPHPPVHHLVCHMQRKTQFQGEMTKDMEIRRFEFTREGPEMGSPLYPRYQMSLIRCRDLATVSRLPLHIRYQNYLPLFRYKMILTCQLPLGNSPAHAHNTQLQISCHTFFCLQDIRLL